MLMMAGVLGMMAFGSALALALPLGTEESDDGDDVSGHDAGSATNLPDLIAGTDPAERSDDSSGADAPAGEADEADGWRDADVVDPENGTVTSDQFDTPDRQVSGTASAGADTLWGGPGDDAISGAEGNDQIDGYGGDDRLSGEDGDDALTGDDGDDRLSGGAGADTLAGDAGDDVLMGGAGADTLSGGPGDDLLCGGTGDDALSGGEGDDRLSGGAGDDHLEGDAGADVLTGGAGSDTLDGGAGDDRLTGNDDGAVAARDYLNGGDGDDTLIGGAGDVLSGGAGADDFVLGDWSAPETPGQIADYEAGTDRIVLVCADAQALAATHVTVEPSETAGSAWVSVNGERLVEVANAGDLKASDIAVMTQARFDTL